MASNHFDSGGNARMVDVSDKPPTRRQASAVATIRMSTAAAEMVRSGTGKKGDVLAVARLAAINGTKWTSHLIPLCHAIPIEAVEVEFDWEDNSGANPSLRCQVTCRTTGKTGIEMEALTGASVGVLTVYDMLKSVDRAMEIGAVYLLQKSGGVSGDFRRP